VRPVLFPAIGVTMAEGTLTAWLKQEGDSVAAGDIVAEMETDKATLEIESPVAGVVARLLVAEGDSVEPGHPIAEIAEAGDA
jgi:pyruvate/2-oxoglutarate dehydrogenase complex dihydrolipoamide acyltransferase (E2) component